MVHDEPHLVYMRSICAHHFVIRFILGMLIVLFFRCMISLFNPVHRRGEGIKWGFTSYTVIMFFLATVYTAINLHMFSISYIDNRNSPDGPYLYSVEISFTVIGFVYTAAFRLNNWLADGLLVRSLLDPAVAHPGI